MNWTEYLENRSHIVKYSPGDKVKIIGSPWGIYEMAKQIGTTQEIEKFYCWIGCKEHYLLKGIGHWIWCVDYLEPVEEKIEFETDELMNLLKE